MTMFSKGTWTILKINKPEDATVDPVEQFRTTLTDSGTQFIPVCAISRAIQEQTQTFGLAPYSHPRLGDEEEVQYEATGVPQIESLETFLATHPDFVDWTYADGKFTSESGMSTLDGAKFWEPNLDNWQILPGVYGMWLMGFEYMDANDSASKKEKIAYDYNAPFKLQSGELKKQITEQVADLNTFTRKHYQIILDFNQGYAWINSAGKPVVETSLAILDELGLSLSTPDNLLEDADGSVMGADSITGAINKLYQGSEINAEVLERLAAVKLHGVAGIEPHENATMEKILKAFCAFTEAQGFHIGMSGPIGIFLNENMPSPTGVKTNFEALELMEWSEGTSICEADLTFTEYIERTTKSGEVKRMLSKRFSIHATPAIYHKEAPGLIVRGINIENFKFTVKTHVKATDRQPTIQEYWAMYYDSLKTSVFTYFSVLKDVVEGV